MTMRDTTFTSSSADIVWPVVFMDRQRYNDWGDFVGSNILTVRYKGFTRADLFSFHSSSSATPVPSAGALLGLRAIK